MCKMAKKKTTTKKTPAVDETPKTDAHTGIKEMAPVKATIGEPVNIGHHDDKATATDEMSGADPEEMKNLRVMLFPKWEKMSPEKVETNISKFPIEMLFDSITPDIARSAWDAYQVEQRERMEREAKARAIEAFRGTLKGYSIPESISKLAIEAGKLGGKLVISAAETEVEVEDGETGEKVKQMTMAVTIDISTGAISGGKRGRPAGSTNGTGKGSGYNYWQMLIKFKNRGNSEAAKVLDIMAPGRKPKPDGTKGFLYYIPGRAEPMKLNAAVEAVASAALFAELGEAIARAKRGEKV